MPTRPSSPCAALRPPKQAGIAITMLPTLYAYGGFGGQAIRLPGQRRFINDADRYVRILERLHPLCRDNPLRKLGISPHSLRAVTAELLSDVIAALDRLDTAAPIHIHIAEQTKEVDDCLAWSGKRPVEYLMENFALSPRWCAIHATHMTEAETRRPCAIRRNCRALPDHRSQSWRRHLSGRSLPRRQGCDCHRLRQPHHGEPGGRPAPARIFPAPARSCPQCLGRCARPFDRTPPL